MQQVITLVPIRNGKGDGPNRADPKSKHGMVEFDADAPCTVEFHPTGVFAQKTYRLHKGANMFPIDTESGTTTFTIRYDDTANKKMTMATPGGPNDIIVP